MTKVMGVMESSGGGWRKREAGSEELSTGKVDEGMMDGEEGEGEGGGVEG